MFFLVCFDIADNRSRSKAVKILHEYGSRVQKSVFECANLDDRRFVRMKERLDAVIDHKKDTFRFYPLCRDCLQKMAFSGTGHAPVTRNFAVI